MGDFATGEEVPLGGTNWTCDVVDELLYESRQLRRFRDELTRTAVLSERVGRGFAFLAFILAIINTVEDYPIVIILLPIFVGIVAFFDLQNKAALKYSAAFQLQDIIDNIRDELLLRVPQRIDGVVFLRTVQSTRTSVQAQYRLDSNY
jgi:hypothetical protein